MMGITVLSASPIPCFLRGDLRLKVGILFDMMLMLVVLVELMWMEF